LARASASAGFSAAGVDVMGDGSVVAFAGSVRRRELDPAPGEDAFEAVGRELASGR